MKFVYHLQSWGLVVPTFRSDFVANWILDTECSTLPTSVIISQVIRFMTMNQYISWSMNQIMNQMQHDATSNESNALAKGLTTELILFNSCLHSYSTRYSPRAMQRTWHSWRPAGASLAPAQRCIAAAPRCPPSFERPGSRAGSPHGHTAIHPLPELAMFGLWKFEQKKLQIVQWCPGTCTIDTSRVSRVLGCENWLCKLTLFYSLMSCGADILSKCPRLAPALPHGPGQCTPAWLTSAFRRYIFDVRCLTRCPPEKRKINKTSNRKWRGRKIKSTYN